jgi:sugar phosphate permease
VPAPTRTRELNDGGSGLQASDAANDDAAAKRIRWGRRGWLLLIVFVTYSLAYLDRANYGFGAAAGMAKTLSITQGRTGLLGALFFLGYFGFQVPGMVAAKRYSCSRLVFVALIAWGALAALTGVLRVFWMLAIDRLLLGVAESIIFPAMLLLLTRWFTGAERSRANTLLMLGNPVTVLWMSAITGFLIQRFGWQRTFVLEGLPSIAWAVVWVLTMRDHPTEAGWLPKDQAITLTEQLAEDQRALPTGAHSSTDRLKAALLRKDVVVLSLQYFAWSLGVYGFVLWLPTIVRQGGSYSMGKTGLVSAAPYLAAIILMLIVSHLSDAKQKRREFVWPLLLISGLAMLGSSLVERRSFVAAFVCLIVAGACMYAPYGPFFSIFPERIPQRRVGEVMALVNSAGALGAFVGVYVVGWLRTVTGSERAGYLVMSAFLILSSLLIVWLPNPPAEDPLRESANA